MQDSSSFAGSYLPSSGRHGSHSLGSPLALLPEEGQSSARLAGRQAASQRRKGLGRWSGRERLKKKRF